jgi:hypothetical protein
MAQQVTIIGKMTKADGTTESVQIDGIAALQVDPGYGIPAPPYPGQPPVQPPGIWGPPGPWPTPPIFLPPGGGGMPPGVVTPPIYYPPEVSHPIVLPEPPEIPEIPERPPITPPGGILGEGWQWYYTQMFGWILVYRPPGGGGKPQPPLGNAPIATPHK